MSFPNGRHAPGHNGLEYRKFQLIDAFFDQPDNLVYQSQENR